MLLLLGLKGFRKPFSAHGRTAERGRRVGKEAQKWEEGEKRRAVMGGG
jgi:hypothetical protein